MERLATRRRLYWCSACGSLARDDERLAPILVDRVRSFRSLVSHSGWLLNKWIGYGLEEASRLPADRREYDGPKMEAGQ